MVTALLGIVGAASLLAGCAGGQGGPTATGSASAQVFNDADVTFAQQMIVHHQEAIVMADMAEARAESPQIKQLATQIKSEQEPEIQTMSGWLRAWGKPVPGVTTGTVSPMPTAGETPPMPTMMPGMTPQPRMSDMMQMHGAQFDHMFLQMMIEHHQGAIAMAKTEQASGANPQAKQLAKNIETSQTAQIAQMQQMLQSPSAPHS
jgi:uncharacterized protein (DUF305 family)